MAPADSAPAAVPPRRTDGARHRSADRARGARRRPSLRSRLASRNIPCAIDTIRHSPLATRSRAAGHPGAVLRPFAPGLHDPRAARRGRRDHGVERAVPDRSWKLGPALAAGNTVVLKPAEDASLSTLYLGKLIEEAGFPAGTVNIVPGTGETAGAALVRHRRSTRSASPAAPRSGARSRSSGAKQFRRVDAGARRKSPQIILEDADLAAVPFRAVAIGVFGTRARSAPRGHACSLQAYYDESCPGSPRRPQRVTRQPLR